MVAHQCKYCEYTTNRKNNLDRHCIHKHPTELIQEMYNSNIGQNVHSIGQDVHSIGQDVHISDQNVNPLNPNVNLKYICDRCNKGFVSNSKLIRHHTSCKGTLRKNECIFCHKIYASRQSLCNHKKNCTGISMNNENDIIPLNGKNIVEESSNTHLQVTNVTNYGNVQNAQTIQNNTTINILTFPDSVEDEDFEFKTSHITKKHLKHITRNIRPEVSFSKFAILTLEQPENRMVKKSGANVNYSMIHVGNGIWELIIDDYIYPTIIHFLTCGALKIIEDNPELKNLIKPFREFVDHINTNNESSKYKNVEANVKLVVINLTKRKSVTQNV